jgi:sugar O-acyltransferase (sialic acid O-acetyltransferase NeuD family)
MIKDIIIIGAGNPDIIRLIEDINQHKMTYNILGFLDIDPKKHDKQFFGYTILGDDCLLKNKFWNVAIINNVMATTLKHQKVQDRIISYGYINFPNLIHPSINLKYVKVGVGNIVYENVNFGVGTSVGDFNIFYPGSIAGHESIIGNHCLLAAKSLLSARSEIANRVFLGNGSIIIPGKYICDDCFIGAGSVVIKSLKQKVKVFGNPAIKIE